MLVTIKQKHSLFKADIPANSIELLEFEEVGYPIVAQKDLYSVGEKVFFIEPDFCLPDIALFETYTKPCGDATKTKLGKGSRIKALKFNLHKGDNVPVYSYGIVMPLSEIQLWCDQNFISIEQPNLIEELGITKYTTPDDSKGSVKGGASKPFPSMMYKTDETNINKMWNSLTYPIHLVGTLKADGSSTTIYYKKGKGGICSRNLEKPLTVTKTTGIRKATLWEKLLRLFKFKVDLQIKETVDSDSDFVIAGKPILEKLEAYCQANNRNLAIRAELVGEKSKGSGNKNNPHSKLPLSLFAFGIDDYTNYTEKLPYNEFKQLCKALELSPCEEVFNRVFNSKEEVVEACESYFQKNLVEGIVIRSLDSKWSAKYMNLAYDSKKD